MERTRTAPHGQRFRWWFLAAPLALAGIAAPAVVVYACIGVVALTATPATVQPGGSVTLSGKDFVPDKPILVHLDSVNGPVIFTVPSSAGDVMTSHFSITMPVPSSVPVGAHVLVATQDEHDMNGGNPARAALYVGASPALAPAGTDRPAVALVDDGPGVGGLALIALIAAVATGIAFAVVAAIAGRSRSEATTGA